MKAKYQNPQTEIITLTVNQLMIGSNNYGKPEEGQDLNKAETTEATSGNLSRYNIWDDEEEE